MWPANRDALRAMVLALALALAGTALGCGSQGDDSGSTGASEARGEPELWFEDVARDAGIELVSWSGSDPKSKPTILVSMGQGAAWLDDDGDGALDLFVVNGSSLDPLPAPTPANAFYRNRGDGTFDDVSAVSGTNDTDWGHGVAAADFDNDGDTDLYVTNWGPHRLYRNGGNGSFEDVGRAAGVDAARADGRRNWGMGAAWGDIDRDGFLDLYVTHYLLFDPADPPNGGATQVWRGIRGASYGPHGCTPQQDALFRNRGDGTFEDVSRSSGVLAAASAYALGAVFGDFDLDGDADLYVANDSMPNYMFVNDGSGKFIDRALEQGVAFAEHGNAQASMGLAAGDFDGDGDDELITTNFVYDVNTLYDNQGGSFRDVTTSTGLGAPGRNQLCWGASFADFDNDGDTDVFIASGHLYPMADEDAPTSGYAQADELLENRGGRLHLANAEAGPAWRRKAVTRGSAMGDYDGDGNVDVVALNLHEAPTLYANRTRNPGAWFEVKLRGTQSNRDGIGARVTVHAGQRTWSAERRAGSSYLSTESPWLHFGLGNTQRIDRVEVRWPSGRVTEHGPFDVDRREVLREE